MPGLTCGIPMRRGKTNKPDLCPECGEERYEGRCRQCEEREQEYRRREEERRVGYPPILPDDYKGESYQ